MTIAERRRGGRRTAAGERRGSVNKRGAKNWMDVAAGHITRFTPYPVYRKMLNNALSRLLSQRASWVDISKQTNNIAHNIYS